MQFVKRTHRASLHSLIQTILGHRCLHAAQVQSSIRYSGGIAPGHSQLLISSLSSSIRRSLVTLEQAQGQIDELNDKFVEARDEIEYAQEDAETTYFNDSHKVAKEAVGVITSMYRDIQDTLNEADKGKLQRSMGMKMEQLKAELGQLDELHA
ncbi:hypothetical protein ABBQ32_001572 [Trebouxia sp. C0010 RCD-2024]